MRKSTFRRIATAITFLSFLILMILLITPNNSFLFEQKPIENQQDLGNQILVAFKNKFISSDTIFLAKRRTYNIDCGTGIRTNYIDNIKNKYYKITHRDVIYVDNLFGKPLEETHKIILTEIVTYSNEQYPNDSDSMVVNGNAIDSLKSKGKKIFILNFDSITSDKVEVVFIDYLKNSSVLHLSFVLENSKWKLASKNS
ncbi:hypothetical protein EV143_10350 [Flavobacterium chryseum]|uniref:hypothetical protein n=1 Tax=Flavobacterium sp. P3160 TaxID=2512113 RepID=UPI00105DC646|nr:hypothetical protein [Flavobacterium sp. P3160]TDO77818.1 hypothetical protein EV143_10350 [Flavobacterium sp. P3160]